jgi:hypothetical protein
VQSIATRTYKPLSSCYTQLDQAARGAFHTTKHNGAQAQASVPSITRMGVISA